MRKEEHYTDEQLKEVAKTAKRIKDWELPDDAVRVGYEFLPYGDAMYFRLTDGTYVYTCFSIGD